LLLLGYNPTIRRAKARDLADDSKVLFPAQGRKRTPLGGPAERLVTKKDRGLGRLERPAVSLQLVKKVLGEMKRAEFVRLAGRGGGARWKVVRAG